jgi:calcium-dependent protein kinase
MDQTSKALRRNSSEENNSITVYTRSSVRRIVGRVSDYYEIYDILGEGAYGCVRKVLHKELQVYMAMKSIIKSYVELTEFQNMLLEVEILRRLDHPNILKINEVIEDNKCFHLVTELCTGGELLEKIIEHQKLEEQQVATYMSQIFSAIYYCHEHQVLHRDIKPENLMFVDDSEDSDLKVIDFGISKMIDTQGKYFKCGKVRHKQPFYSAPETFDGVFTEKSDIWSCGVVMYLMLCGYLPFKKRSPSSLVEEITHTKIDFPVKEWGKVSNEARALVIRLLDKDPENRPSAQVVLKNVWFNKVMNNKVQKLCLNSVENLRHFHCQTKIQQAAFEYIASHLLTAEEIKAHKATFLALDADGDGKLSSNEILGTVNDVIISRLEEVPSILERCDSDLSGFIDYTEFLSATMDWKIILSTKKLEAAFRAFDLNGNGKIDIEELKEMIGGIDEQGYQFLMQQIDTDGDGEINFDEFKVICLQIPKLFEN